MQLPLYNIYILNRLESLAQWDLKQCTACLIQFNVCCCHGSVRGYIYLAAISLSTRYLDKSSKLPCSDWIQLPLYVAAVTGQDVLWCK